ncbi:lipoyl(octanoyl) transferase LipB [Salinisphaera orenii]|uniref:lipoyl(octanoyl) transferase LipB n=1 Tax=Salinisphaera orenii TaxID=856731 RepID=UPI00296ED9E3
MIEIGYQDWTPRAYRPVWSAMRAFCRDRTEQTADQIWLLCHQPVFTQGRNGNAEHVLASGDIEVIPTDRGGQVTYHGPGQIMAYVLFDLKRGGFGIRRLISTLEDSVIDTLAAYDVEAWSDRSAPGVYTRRGKISAVGLRVSRGCSYHGVALNVDMDLEPFERIAPCGFADMSVTQLADFGVSPGLDAVAARLGNALTARLAEPSVA